MARSYEKSKVILNALAWFWVGSIVTGFISLAAIQKPARPTNNATQKQAYPGYTLITPLTTKNDDKEPGNIYLIDNQEKIIHKWTTKYPALYSILLPKGNIITAITLPGKEKNAKTGRIEKLDKNSRVLWSYDNEGLTHDFAPLANGNVLVTIREKVPDAVANLVRANGPKIPQVTDLYANAILEINPAGSVVTTWHAYDHLDPSIDVMEPTAPPSEWTHLNSVKFIKKNPITQTPAYLVSLRNISTIALIDYSTGDIIWRSPKNTFHYQHDATFTDAGTILAFDNNPFGMPKISAIYGSRVLEINPQDNSIVWSFNGGDSSIASLQFESSIMSGAERLPNGNTLITDGIHGDIVEVTPQKNIVWRYHNELTAHATSQNTTLYNSLFKSRKYSQSLVDTISKAN